MNEQLIPIGQVPQLVDLTATLSAWYGRRDHRGPRTVLRRDGSSSEFANLAVVTAIQLELSRGDLDKNPLTSGG
jgi:hypothetical protein